MTCNKYLHLTLAELPNIETGISHGSTKAALQKPWARIKAPLVKKSNRTASNPFLPVIRLIVLYSQNAKTKKRLPALLNALPI